MSEFATALEFLKSRVARIAWGPYEIQTHSLIDLSLQVETLII